MRTPWLGPLTYAAIAACIVMLIAIAPAEAHGKVVNIALTCVAPDPARPLTKVCTAFLKYADGDPVPNARFQMTARREGKAEAILGPVAFRSLDRDGVYSAGVNFPAYGRWRMRFQVLEPGRGEAELVENLLPPVPGTGSVAPVQLQVAFKFGLADVRNLTLRILHLLAAAGWFASIVLVLVLFRVPGPEQRARSLARAAAIFPRAAGGSLLLLTLTGIANAAYNAPTRPPGLLAPALIARLPFGSAYLAAFLTKMVLTLAVLGATVALGFILRQTYGQPAPAIAGGSPEGNGLPASQDRKVTWLAGVNLVLGLLIFASVAVLGYLHVVTHVAAAVGAR